MSYDVIVVGSGPAGTFAALRLTGLRVLMIDVGKTPPSALGEDTSLIDLKRAGRAAPADILGPQLESLHNITKAYLSPKLKAPQLRFVTDAWQQFSPVEGDGFDATMSFARGGFANAWGAGTYRFDDADLEGFPVTAQELEPFYDIATEHMGISGADDDTTPFFGSTAGLLPPLELGFIGNDLLSRYAKRRAWFQRNHVVVGHPRIAVLTRDHHGRSAYRYTGAEFFRPWISGIYNPVFTLAKLIEAGTVDYRPGRLVETFREDKGNVVVTSRDVSSGTVEEHRAHKLVLAAGALNSGKIALRSRQDNDSRLPVLDNLVSFVPLLNLRRVGWSPPRRTVPLQANLIYSGPLETEAIQGSCYGMSATLASDFAFEFPLSARANLDLIKYVLPALTTLQLFYPDRGQEGNHLRLTSDGRLEIRYRPRVRGTVERHLVRVFRRAGYLSTSRLCKYLPAGHSFHYAGCLPMRERPNGPYETERTGRLSGTKSVFVADAANFPGLPSKNLTFTIIANAMRIADCLRADLST